MQSTVVVAVLFWSHLVAVECSNLTAPTSLKTDVGSNEQEEADELAKAAQLLHVDRDEPLTADDNAPALDVAAEIKEGSKVSDKWETGRTGHCHNNSIL